MSQEVAVWLGVLGGGILVAFITAIYQLGRYSMRVEQLEASVVRLSHALSAMEGELRSLKETYLVNMGKARLRPVIEHASDVG